MILEGEPARNSSKGRHPQNVAKAEMPRSTDGRQRNLHHSAARKETLYTTDEEDEKEGVGDPPARGVRSLEACCILDRHTTLIGLWSPIICA